MGRNGEMGRLSAASLLPSPGQAGYAEAAPAPTQGGNSGIS